MYVWLLLIVNIGVAYGIWVLAPTIYGCHYGLIWLLIRVHTALLLYVFLPTVYGCHWRLIWLMLMVFIDETHAGLVSLTVYMVVHYVIYGCRSIYLTFCQMFNIVLLICGREICLTIVPVKYQRYTSIFRKNSKFSIKRAMVGSGPRTHDPSFL